MFGGTSPQARIFQTYVALTHRRSGVGRVLVQEVARRAEEFSYLSIRVEVASDLLAANEFYKNQGFRRVRERAGGKTRNRTIITRVLELNSPSLLDFAAYGTADGPAISLTLSTAAQAPLYLIDLNVLFDITKRRGNALGAGRVLAAAMDNSVSLAVSSEFVAELERNTKADQPDPVLELARALPRLRSPPPTSVATHRGTLAPLLFPERWAGSKLTKQDESDIVHLATAIEENADGFITSEKVILSCGEWFRTNHSLSVISPEVFGKHYTASTRVSAAFQVSVHGRTISAGEATPDQNGPARSFLDRQDIPDRVANAALAQGTSTAPRRRIIVRDGDQIVAFGSWSPPRGHERVLRLYLFADENDSTVQAAIDHIIDSAARDVASEQPAVLQMSPAPEHVLIRDRAIALGFRPRSGSSTRAGKLEKLCLGSVVTEQNWAAVRQRVVDLAGIELPDEPPVFRAPDDQVLLRAAGGQHAATALRALEDFVAPTIFALRGRPAAIVPIWPIYAEALFRGSTQPSFLNDEQVALLRQRRYFSADRTYAAIPDQGLLFFYESNHKGSGRSSAIAMARILRRYLARQNDAENLARERGVLSASEVQGIAKGDEVCVTEFDNIMMFAKPVPLKVLKEIGCADNANMVTARCLNSEAVFALIEAGQPRCTR